MRGARFAVLARLSKTARLTLMAQSVSQTDPAAGIEPSAATPTDQSSVAQTSIEPEPAGLMTAGAPGWYSLVATSFLICEFNPIGAIGIAAGVAPTRASPLGWALAAASFMLALSGFIYAEWRASADGNQRALEICAVITIAAGIIPCLSAISIPALIVWPIGMMFLVTGGSGLRAARKLADPANEAPAEVEPSVTVPYATVDEAPVSEQTAKPRRKRRRNRKRRQR